MAVSVPAIDSIQRIALSKRVLAAVAALRAVLGIVAIPLAPMLYHDHFMWLVLFVRLRTFCSSPGSCSGTARSD